MNAKTKVYLQFPWKFSDSSYYKFLLENPPQEIEYIKPPNNAGVIESKAKKFLYKNLKKFVKKTLRSIGFAKPNIRKVKTDKKYDIIHGAHCLIKNDCPWVADFEHPGQFTIPPTRGEKRVKKKVRRILEGSNCKKILAWSENLKEWILQEYPEIRDKIEVVYPATPNPKNTNVKKEDKGKTTLLFVSRDFDIKGGRIALEIIDDLTKKYENVEGKIVSDAPKDILEKYKDNDKIKFLGLVPQDKLFEEIYPESDIFVYPSFSDTFGFAVLEAQGFGLPVVSMKTQSTHSIEETVQEGKTGFFVENMQSNASKRGYSKEIVEKIQDKTEKLIKNKKLRDKMSKKAFWEIEKGKFSIKERNKKLQRIYADALKS